jgi:hypothetical protein
LSLSESLEYGHIAKKVELYSIHKRTVGTGVKVTEPENTYTVKKLGARGPLGPPMGPGQRLGTRKLLQFGDYKSSRKTQVLHLSSDIIIISYGYLQETT